MNTLHDYFSLSNIVQYRISGGGGGKKKHEIQGLVLMLIGAVQMSY